MPPLETPLLAATRAELGKDIAFIKGTGAPYEQ